MKPKKNIKQDEYITIKMYMKVDGKIRRSKKKTYYKRAYETYGITLDHFAQIIFIYDHIFHNGTTYAYDGLMQEMEKKLPKKDNETAQSVFEKYWINLDKTINDEFLRLNKGDKKSKYPLFPEEGDYLKHSINSICNSFLRSPIPVKYGFLYWFHKYLMNNSIKEFESDLKNIPDGIKEIIDTQMVAIKTKNK